MTIKDNPDLEDALDGLIHAVRYAESIGEDDIASDAASCYQALGAAAPEEHWDGPLSTEEVVEMLDLEDSGGEG